MKRSLFFTLLLLLALMLAACRPPLTDGEILDMAEDRLDSGDILDMAEDVLEDDDKMIVDKDEYDDLVEQAMAPAPTPEPTPEPQPSFQPITGQTEGSLLLSPKEFDVYANGEVIISVSTQYRAMVLFDSEEEYGYNGYTLQTARGIHLGSTIEEVAAAYKGVPAMIDLEDAGPLDEYIKENPDTYKKAGIMISYDTAFVGDTAMSLTDLYDYLDENGIDFMDYMHKSVFYYKEHGIVDLNMVIDCYKGVVTSIRITK